MRTRRHRELLHAFVTDFAATLGCLSYERLAITLISSWPEHTVYEIKTANLNPLPLESAAPLWLSASQRVLVRHTLEASHADEVVITGYNVRISQGENGTHEVLALHFDPSSQDRKSRTHHMHVGASVYRPVQTRHLKDFHKRHIPTGHVTFPMVVRFLIEELGVEPINPNWEQVLSAAVDQGESA